MKVKKIFIVCVIFGLLGCATLPPSEPIDPQKACLGISVDIGSKLGVGMSAHQVFFIKLDEREDLYSKQNFIRSNYAKDGQIYLLNANPGRYAAVGCYNSAGAPQPFSYTYIFSKELIKKTEITVAPGTIAFMGKYTIKPSLGFKDADDAQLHYLRLIAPGAQTNILVMGLTRRGYYHCSLLKDECDKQAEAEFLTNATNHFKDTGWVNIIQKQMEALPGQDTEAIIRTEKVDKQKTSSGHASETQMAAISAVEINKEEPWTGTWIVKDGPFGNMYFKLKQSGNKVNSIRGSSHEVKGKVIGDRLKGWYKESTGDTDINLKIAKDGKTFKGTSYNPFYKNYKLEGERQE